MDKKKKIILAIVLSFVLAAASWFIIDFSKRQALKKQLKLIEDQIASTEKQIEDLSALSSEEIIKREKEQEILSDRKVTDDVPVAGVEVLKEASRKIITNTAYGYSIELPLNLLLARSISGEHLEFHDR